MYEPDPSTRREVKTADPSLAAETQSLYNPAFVSWEFDAESGSQVAVITKDGFRAFAHSQNGKYTQGERLASALFGGDGIDRHAYYHFILTDHEEAAIGLKVDTIKMLLIQLKSGELKIENMGQKSIGLLVMLDKYCDQVFRDGAEAN